MLTLFIDEVAKYRDYSAADEKGDYARIFEEEYTQYLNEVLDLEERHISSTSKTLRLKRHTADTSPSTRKQSGLPTLTLKSVVRTRACQMMWMRTT